MTAANPRRRRIGLADVSARLAARILVGVVVIFAVVPAVIVVLNSFSADDFLAFPPSHWGGRQYAALFDSSSWLHAIGTSFLLAIPVGLLTLAISIPAVLAINSARLRRFAPVLEVLCLAPLLIPITAYVVALYLLYLKIHLVGSFFGLVFAQSLGSVPVAILIMSSALRRIPRNLELAAMSLGASRFRATVGITGRQLSPAIAVSFLVAFLFSFDDAIYVTFLGGSDINPLSRRIYDSLRLGVDPVVTAISTLLMVFTALLVTLTAVLRRRSS